MNLTEQLKKKVAKVKLKETGAYVSISAGDLIYDILRVDPRAVQGVDFVRKDDLSDVFSFGKKEILERKEKSAESLEGLHNTYTGYTFERVVALDFQKRGAEVVFPENARQSGYDLIINGEKFQVKTEENGISLIEDHFEKYPYRVIANSEAAELSNLRSSSPCTTPSKWVITSIGRNRRDDGDNISINRAAK